ncbi:Med5-domain-containing protein [Lepidopterella palustris CBS 459.81]|uniref:Mediator of RNA polymerase II transcription subunit 5 n=1 Tax=Lepidopterella palustris CBS 459.81 TaxID=1314670 RepID=A0A8E2JGB8_9PEZI|nr:Med5-domain-containing protein [Lepidopterella palustris CBS 459.81]
MDPSLKEWTVFIDRCLEQRVRADRFEAASNQLHIKSPISGRKLSEALLRPRSSSANTVDPLIVVYLERLLALKRFDASDLLSQAFKWSRDYPPKTGDERVGPKDDQSRWRNPPELEEIIFNRLHKAFHSGERPQNPHEARETLTIVSRWMSAVATAHTSDSMIQEMTGLQQPQQQSINLREALGMLVVGLIENLRVIEILNNGRLKDVRKSFARSLSVFIPFLAQTSIPIANRLEISQKEHGLDDNTSNELNGGTGGNELDVAAIQLDAVMDLPIINTRAGLYIFINSLLVARPLTDDITIINYLHSRYKIDAQNLATDLITASFDVLSNAMYRSESSQTMFCLKSFLVNKIPTLLAQLQGSIYPMTSEFCITQALSHVDPNAFPAFSQGFDMTGGSNVLSDVRQDFLNACALHNLIPVNSIERLLGETPMQGPPEVKYVKNELLKQCKENFEKVNMFTDEIENLDGNGGAIVGAVTEFISHLCETQMTMYLKTICNLLSKKPQALDVMLQFTSPASILRPLCQFLDEWRYDGDQGEYQLVYDEFGAILLLILAFVHRYDLTYHDLGINHDSFISQLLERGHLSLPADELTDDQGKHLGGWLRGLFDANMAINDELMSSCRPQEFYLLVPTLFSQIVFACSADVLSLDAVKGGLEYLLETFLLPSLVGAITWMTSHALEQTHQDLDILMQIFHKLIRPASMSGDAQTMHTTILSILSRRLEKCLHTIRHRDPSRTDIDPLLEAIKDNLNYERLGYASISELEQWTSTPGNTLRSSLRNTIHSLVMWSSNGAIQLTPPGYTHRQLFTTLKLLGAHKTLRAIIEEAKVQAEAGNGSVALDVATALICAPSTENSPLQVHWVTSSIAQPSPPRTRLNLREMLKVELDAAVGFVLQDPLTAETIVRLHRRVEAQLAIAGTDTLPGTQLGLGVSVGVGVGVEAHSMPGIDLNIVDDAAAAAAVAGVGDMDQQALERGLERHLSLGNAASGLDLGPGGDVGDVGDLDLGGDMGMGMDGMGMGDDDDAWGLDFDNM